jgi:hypothetical protein
MALPYSENSKLFSAASATADATFDAGYAAQVQISITTAGFTGTLDIQGKLTSEGTFANLPYVVLGSYAPATFSQLSFTTETATTTYVVLMPMPFMKVVMTRSAGTITAYQRGLSTAFPLPVLDAPRGAWSFTHAPAGGAQATGTKASAGTGLKNVLTGFTVSALATGAVTAEKVTFVLRDGATGAGTIIYGFDMEPLAAAAGNTNTQFGLSGLWIPGTAATAMCFESNDPTDTDLTLTINAWGEVTI